MRFLKNVMGRGQDASRGTAAQSYNLLADDSVAEDDEWAEFVGDDDADDFDAETGAPDAMSDEEAAFEAGVRRALGRSEATVADTAADDRTEAAAETGSRPTSDNVKIWELFGDDEDDESAASGESASGEDALSGGRQTQADLAREALEMIRARRAGGRPETAGPVVVANTAPLAAAPSRVASAPSPVAAAPAPGGRAKTRLIGFAAGDAAEPDVFDQKRKAAASPAAMFPVGWIVVIEGPGRGASFPLETGLSQIGRSADQTIPLTFGDQSISRQNHASIAYDDEENAFFLGHGGKANIVRLNGRPVLSTEELSNADLIRIGETTLRFVALCGPDFAWDLTDEDEEDVA